MSVVLYGSQTDDAKSSVDGLWCSEWLHEPPWCSCIGFVVGAQLFYMPKQWCYLCESSNAYLHLSWLQDTWLSQLLQEYVHGGHILIPVEIVCLYIFLWPGTFRDGSSFSIYSPNHVGHLDPSEAVLHPHCSWYVYIRAPSAKSIVSDDVHSGRSLMKARKRRGPRTVPCGTPEMTSASVDTEPSTSTCCFL